MRRARKLFHICESAAIAVVGCFALGVSPALLAMAYYEHQSPHLVSGVTLAFVGLLLVLNALERLLVGTRNQVNNDRLRRSSL